MAAGGQAGSSLLGDLSVGSSVDCRELECGVRALREVAKQRPALFRAEAEAGDCASLLLTALLSSDPPAAAKAKATAPPKAKGKAKAQTKRKGKAPRKGKRRADESEEEEEEEEEAEAGEDQQEEQPLTNEDEGDRVGYYHQAQVLGMKTLVAYLKDAHRSYAAAHAPKPDKDTSPSASASAAGPAQAGDPALVDLFKKLTSLLLRFLSTQGDVTGNVVWPLIPPASLLVCFCFLFPLYFLS